MCALHCGNGDTESEGLSTIISSDMIRQKVNECIALWQWRHRVRVVREARQQGLKDSMQHCCPSPETLSNFLHTHEPRFVMLHRRQHHGFLGHHSEVTTPSNANVSQLKKIICRECQHGVLHDINATDLLWIFNQMFVTHHMPFLKILPIIFFQFLQFFG